MSHQPAHPPSRPDDWSRLDDDSRWMAEHDGELLNKYRGQWIAVFNRQVIGAGKTAVEAAQSADRVASSDEYILCACEYYPDFTDAHILVV